VKATGPAGRAIADIAGIAGGLGAEGSTVTVRQLVTDAGLSREQALGALGGAESGVLDKKTRASIMSTVAGARAAGIVTPSGGMDRRVGVDQEMLKTLNSLNRAIEAQTTYLEVVTDALPLTDRQRHNVKVKLDAARADHHAGQGGEVTTGVGK
jgi:hypothetical protein